MASLTSKLVIDATVLIDLYNGGLLLKFFELSYKFEFYCPDFVFEGELLDVRFDKSVKEKLPKVGLQVYKFSGEEVQAIFVWHNEHPNLSVADLSAFLLAKKMGAILLSGDKALRRLAESRGIEVHGILWVLELLVDREKILSPQEGKCALQRILQNNSWLPKKECDELLQRWQGFPLDKQHSS